MSYLGIVSLFALLSLSLAGCEATSQNAYSTDSALSSTTSTLSPTPQSDMATPSQTSIPVKGDHIATLTTSKGVIKIKFFPQYAPETVKNFEELSKKGFYNGLTFHRVIPGFMIQGGDPLGNGTGGETYKGPKTMLKGEVNSALHHVHGAVAMANRADPNTATSQFYIVQNKEGAPFLDGGYTIFGQAYVGLDVVDAIANVERDTRDKPLSPVKISKVEISIVE